jgi:hypothetical protein
VVTALGLAVLVGAQAVTAAVPLEQKGKRGAWTLTDTPSAPAGLCIYDGPGPGGNDLDVVEARSPRVFARNRTAKRDGQWIGVRFLFQRSREDGGNGGWETGKKTKVFKKYAFDNAAVGVGKRAWQAQYEGTPHFRVVALISWFKPGTKSVVQGSTRLRYEWYATQLGAANGIEMDRCLPEP